MIPLRVRLGTLAVLSVVTVALAGCSPAEETAPETAPTSATGSESSDGDSDTGTDGDGETEEVVNDSEPVEPATPPTCETLISPSIAADFESVGWSVKTDTFYLGNIEVADGIQCVWADYSGQANDQLQIFGWAPISGEDATNAQNSLEAQDWVREEDASGVYITENPETAFARDENGYGLTYLFADGYVTMADTKQGLLLIEWPA
jgi:hypothetical protein